MMKKVLAILLTLALLLALAGCGGKEASLASDMKSAANDRLEAQKDTEEDETEEKETEAAEEADEESPAEKEPEDEDAPAEAAPAEEAEAAADDSAEDFWAAFGTTKDGTYINEDLGFGCTLDEEWILLSEDEIAALNQLSIDSFDDETIQEQLANVDMFYELVAQHGQGLGMIQVVVENLGRLYGSVLTLDQYIELTVQSLEASMPATGIQDCVVETLTVRFGGGDRDAIRFTGNMSGVEIYQMMVPIKYGEQVALYAVTSYGEDLCGEYLSLFYAVN